jgi:hypothetical protein
VAISPVTSSGVSAANWVAAMLRPACQPRSVRPARKYSSRNIFRFLRASTYTPEVLRMSGSGDMGYSAGGVTTAFDGEQGLVEYPGKYLLVWEQRDGAWLIVAYGISNNQSD